jgi:hypothetical protein
MASPPILTPSGTTGLNVQKWKTTVEPATYQKMVAVPIFDDLDRPLGQLNIPKWARVSSTVLAQSADGTGLTPSNVIGTPASVTPAGNYIMTQWSENEDAQVPYNIDAGSASECENALAEGSDQSVLANVATLTQTMSAASLSVTMWRQAIGRLTGNTNGMTMPGATSIYCILSNTQYPNLANIPEFNNAEMRGDSENPYVKGIVVKAGGVMVNISTVVTADGTGWHNFIGRADCIGVAWNARTRIKRQDYELTNKLIVYNNFGSTVVHDLRGIDLRTTVSGL